MQRALAASAALVVVATEGMAQARVVRGVVLDTAERPLGMVNVSAKGASVVTDDSGRFVIQLQSRDRVSFDVKRVGYLPSRFGLAAGGDTTIQMMLFPTVQLLERVKVEEREPASASLRGFEERLRDKEKGVNNGHFITETEIGERNPERTSQLFEGIPSIRVVRGSKGAGRDEWVITGRSRSILTTRLAYCGFTIFLDGVRLNSAKDGGGVDTSTVAIDDFVSPLSIAGIEIYSRPTDAPPRFQLLNGSCGIALIWTKRR